ncbi:hypothetical protein BC834DRAFT_1034999 [Gloeopeniophorella convolvens]|nr:hypothetical protein BC834DRAFT_1034999 [Gloeopeniophorella convolvens]
MSAPATLGPPPAFPGDLSWSMAALVSLWITGPLWGMNVCIFILCAHVLYIKGLKGSNLFMLIVATTQFALATGHAVTVLVQLIRSFAGILTGPSLYILDQSTPEHVAQTVLYVTNSLIGDAILIWRLYIIWNRNFWLCVPFVILCIATAVSGYTAVANIAQLSTTGTVFLHNVHPWLLATWSLSIATQFGATLLIGYRFWRSIQWNLRGIRASRLTVLWTLVESGALYSVTTIFLLGFSSSNTGALFANALGQISALAPTLIIVRAGLRSAGSSGSSFSPAKGSINNPYNPSYAPSVRPTLRDVEASTSRDDDMVVHIGKAAEIHLDDFAHGQRGVPPDPSSGARSEPPK